jgi:8-oxo-dGTP pyrophosphatase MutT (NUDIX family)
MTEPEAAVAIVQAGGPDGSILLMRRAEREGDSWSGHWSFPGGRRDAADSDLLQTALRELEEECGIRLTDEHLEAPLPLTIARRKVGRFLLVAPFLFRVESELATTLDPREAAHSLWAPRSILLDMERHCLRAVPGRPPEMLFPCVPLDGAPLWGFTYRLITDWLGLGAKAEAGIQAASDVLEFLVSQGLTVARGWQAEGVTKVAAVKGEIPVDRVLAQFGTPGPHVAAINCLEVGCGQVRILGPAWEEYRIEGTG